MEPRLASVLTRVSGWAVSALNACWRVFVANCDTENVRFRFHLVTGRIYLSHKFEVAHTYTLKARMDIASVLSGRTMLPITVTRNIFYFLIVGAPL